MLVKICNICGFPSVIPCLFLTNQHKERRFSQSPSHHTKQFSFMGRTPWSCGLSRQPYIGSSRVRISSPPNIDFCSARERKSERKEREKKEKRRWEVEAKFEASILCGCGAIFQYCVILTIVVDGPGQVFKLSTSGGWWPC